MNTERRGTLVVFLGTICFAYVRVWAAEHCELADATTFAEGNEVRQRYYPLVLFRHSTRMDTAKRYDWDEYEHRWFDSPLAGDEQIKADITESVADLLQHMDVKDATDTSLFVVESSPFLRCVETAAVAAKEFGANSVGVNHAVFAKPSTVDSCFSAERGTVATENLGADDNCALFASIRYLTCAQMAERSAYISESAVDLRCADGVDDSSPLLPRHLCEPSADSQQCDDSWAAHVVRSVLDILSDAVLSRKTVVLVTHGEVFKEIASRLLRLEIAKVQANGWLAIPQANAAPLRSAGVVWK